MASQILHGALGLALDECRALGGVDLGKDREVLPLHLLEAAQPVLVGQAWPQRAAVTGGVDARRKRANLRRQRVGLAAEVSQATALDQQPGPLADAVHRVGRGRERPGEAVGQADGPIELAEEVLAGRRQLPEGAAERERRLTSFLPPQDRVGSATSKCAGPRRALAARASSPSQWPDLTCIMRAVRGCVWT
jgi:hypothetical protein